MEKENKIAGWIGTVVFHLLLLLFFMFEGLTQPDPLPEPEGAEIVLGWVDSGSGNTTPSQTPEEEIKETPEASEPTASEETPVSEEVVETQAESPVNVVKPEETTKPKEDKPVVENTEPKETEAEREQREKAERIAALMGKPSGGSKGDDDKPGSAGKEDGKPEGKGVLGGTGTEWSLKGRSYLGGGILTEKPKEEGIVVVDIKVGRDGKVTDVKFNMGKSNTTSLHLFKLAEKAAYNHKFNVDPSASVEQTGTLRFNFKLK